MVLGELSAHPGKVSPFFYFNGSVFGRLLSPLRGPCGVVALISRKRGLNNSTLGPTGFRGIASVRPNRLALGPQALLPTYCRETELQHLGVHEQHRRLLQGGKV